MELVEQGRRQPARVLDLARCGSYGRTDRLGTGEYRLVARKVGRCRDQRVQGNPRCSNVRDRSSEACGQFLVDLLNRLAPGLDPEGIIHRPGPPEPAAE